MTKAFDQKKFLAQTPKEWAEIYSLLKGHGLIPTLVGGSVRDFCLSGQLGHDWDVELTHPVNAFSKDEWKRLGSELSRLGKVSFLPYEIIRLDISPLQFEFSPPRKEIYRSDWQKVGHSNFNAEFDLNLSFDKAVLRRDFTINAIGLRFHSLNEIELLDPLNGLVHLHARTLHYCGEDFQKDPVRFLRAIRFSLKLNLEISSELVSVLNTMPLSGISPAYVWSEMQKSSRPLLMFKNLLEWQKVRGELKLPYSSDLLAGHWEELERMMTDASKHENWIISLEWINCSAIEWLSFFHLNSQHFDRLARWASSTKSFTRILPEIFHGEFEEIIKKTDFGLLFDWYFSTKNLLQKNPTLPLLKMIDEFLPHWTHLYRFEALKDVKHIDPPFRAKYQLWNLCQRL